MPVRRVTALCRRCLPAVLIMIMGCGTGPAESPEREIVSHDQPYPTFGQIERLDPALDALIPPGAEIEQLAAGFDWSEGPLWVGDGEYLLFSDIPPNSIYKWTEGDGASLFMRPSGYDGPRTDIPEPGSNGLTLDLDGRLVLAEHGNRRIAKLQSLDDPNGPKSTIADRYDGRRLDSPNDVIVAPNGDVYFTDPPYGLAGQVDDPEKELDFQGVYLVRRSGDAAGEVVLLAEQTRPNGIAFSPDGRTLYTANSDPDLPVWYAFDVQSDGTVANQRVFFDASHLMSEGRPGLPDGLKVDVAGNLWATGPGGVLILSPDARHLGTIMTGVPTANCAFGGDGSVLYITADMYLARIQTATMGAT